jgi:hypothetical protein
MKLRIVYRLFIFLLAGTLFYFQTGTLLETLFSFGIDSGYSDTRDVFDFASEANGENIPECSENDEDSGEKLKNTVFRIVLLHQHNRTKCVASCYKGINDWGLSLAIDTPPPKLS